MLIREDRAVEVVEQTRDPADVVAALPLARGAPEHLGAIDGYVRLDTVLGSMYVAFSDAGMSYVTFACDDTRFEADFVQQIGRRVIPWQAPPRELLLCLTDELHGNHHPELAFDLGRMTPFERAVLLKTVEIPYGQVRPYAWVAKEIGRDRAVRAVGSALAHNPIPLFIPCHRVVRSDGIIGNYGLGGRDAKRAILMAEGVDVDEIERLARRGYRLVGSSSTRVFCFPTCQQARETAEHDRSYFRDPAEALATGYAPCETCRPT